MYHIQGNAHHKGYLNFENHNMIEDKINEIYSTILQIYL